VNEQSKAAARSARANTQVLKSTADIVVESLVANDIDILYCLPGIQNDPFFDVLFKHQAKIRPLHSRHEQGAAYMAMGAALATGRPQACCLVPGIGFLNAATALATAYSTNAPVMALIAQVPQHQIGRKLGALHEIVDQTPILQTMTKSCARIRGATDAPHIMQAAFNDMLSGRARPVGVEVPTDVWAKTAPVSILPRGEARRTPVDWALIERAADLLTKAERPLIILGGGAQGASAEIRALAERLQAPVTALRMGQGVVDARNPLFVSWPVAHKLWAKADLVLGIGTRLAAPLLQWGTDASLTTIRIDADAEEMSRIVPPTVGIVGDARDMVAALLEVLPAESKKRSLDHIATLRSDIQAKMEAKLAPQLGWLKALRSALPDDGIMVEELTQMGYVARFAFPVYNPRSYIASGFQGTLGWGAATSVGVKAAQPHKPVVSVSGDGGFMFTVQELATAVHFKLPVVFVVFNDNAFGNVKRMQQDLYGGRVIATDLTNPDFVKMADSFGAIGARARTPEELMREVRRGLAADMPTVIDVPVGALEAPFEFMTMGRVRPS
jgi:acetolactate synthase-1/2/3 large subunit